MLTQGLGGLRVSLNFCPEHSCDGQESKRVIAIVQDVEKVNNKNQMGFLERKLVHSSNTRPGWRHRTRGKMKLRES